MLLLVRLFQQELDQVKNIIAEQKALEDDKKFLSEQEKLEAETK